MVNWNTRDARPEAELIRDVKVGPASTKLVDIDRFNLPEQYRRALESERMQALWKKQFKLPDHTRVVKVSMSVCPVCWKQIPMVVFEEDNAIWLKKTCQEHGTFRDLYWGDAELYYYFLQWDSPEYIGKGVANPNVTLDYYLAAGSCPHGCGLCPVHKTNTVLAIVDVTNRCNMKCPVCFANAYAAGYVYEPTLEQIEYMLRILRNERPWPPNALQISGGEPTLRNDLPEIIRMAKKLGFSHVEVNTNGIRVANDIEFYKSLLDAGVSTLYFQFDTLNPTNPGVWRQRLYDAKAYSIVRRRVIENARKLGHRSIVLVVTMAKGYNDKDIGDIINFAIENRDVVRWVNIQPVSFSGRAREYSPDEIRQFRITIPDVIREIEVQTKGQVTRWDWRPVNWPVALGKMVEALTGEPKPVFENNPVCGAATFIYYDEDEKRMIPITRLVDVDAFEKDAWDIYYTAIRGGFWRNIAKVKALKMLRHVKDRRFRGLLYDFLVKKDYESVGQFMFNIVGLGIMHFMDVFNFDIQRIQRCDIHYPTPDGRIIPFCTLNNFHRNRIENSFKMDANDWVRIHMGKNTASFA